MASQFEIDCAAMAGFSYRSTRDPINRFPVPSGWSEITEFYRNLPSGFEAVAFRNTSNPNEIVISFAGTNFPDVTGDWVANGNLAIGSPTAQLREAAMYYCQVRAANPDPNVTITFTGHSLGGGLAALMGVFFNLSAVTFDPAPFRQAADFNEGGLTVYKDLLKYLQDNGVAASILQPFLGYGTLAPDELSGTDRLDEREVRVTSLSVQGEILSNDLIPFSRIGIPDPSLEHGPTDVAGTDLHSQALLTAFVENDQFRQVTYKLTDLLGMIFDSNLYYNDPNKLVNPARNFLENLIRHQVGVQGSFAADAMLDRFTTDLKKIAQAGGLTMANSDLTKALTAFAMQAYYDNRLASAATLFEEVDGFIRFDRSKVADTLTGGTGTKGYSMYFENYLETIPASDRNFIVAMLPTMLDWYIQAGSQAMDATAGAQRAFMLGGSGDDILTGGDQADVLVGNGGDDHLSGGGSYDTIIGGAGNDTLDGGAGDDIMIGGDGQDTLIGGLNDDSLYGGTSDASQDDMAADLLQGGAGFDTYHVGFGDIINDSDGQGTVFYGNEQIASLTFSQQGQTEVYINEATGLVAHYDEASDSLQIFDNDSATPLTSHTDFTIENWTAANFGITLQPEEAPSGSFDITLNGTVNRDEMSIGPIYTNQDIALQLSFTEFPPGVTTVIQDPDAFIPIAVDTPRLKVTGGDSGDFLFGFLRHDHVNGGAGNDIITGNMVSWTNAEGITTLLPLTGSLEGDLLEGGAGDDFIDGSDGADIIAGGEDNDFLSGYDDNDIISGDTGNDVLAGGSHDDILSGGDGDDIILGDGYLGSVEEEPFEVNLDNLSSLGFTFLESTPGGYYIGYETINFRLHNDAPNSGSDIITGGAGRDYLDGGAGNDFLYGDIDADALFGGVGDDYLDGGDGNDRLVGDNGDGTGAGNDYMLGGAGNDLMYGLGGNDTLSGGSGNDELQGGEDNDTLYGDEDDDRLYGQGGDDILFGGVGVDSLFGGGGNDNMRGGDGNDSLSGGDGEDTLYGDDGNDYLTGGDGGDTLYGGAGNDILYDDSGSNVMFGGDGDDRLTGSLDADYLNGGAGNDTYFISDGDTVSEDAIDGIDEVYSPITYTLPDNVENLYLLEQPICPDFYPNDGFGNSLPNLIMGNGYGNYLAGFGLNDSLYGGGGSDTLDGGDGDDTLYGGSQSDLLIGGDGNDSLIGGSSNDTMRGGQGNDIYDVDDPYDEVIEYAGEGSSDTVQSSLASYKLGPNIENLTLTGSPGFYGCIYATGNTQDNVLTGNDFDNVFNGREGADTMIGGGGNDTYVFNRGDGQDTISDYDTTIGTLDIIRFGAEIATSDITVSHSGLDLVLSIDGLDDQIRILNWDSGTPYRIERVEFADGKLYDASYLPTWIEAEPIVISGDEWANTLWGNDGNNTLDGGAGNDTLYGRAGNDTLYGGTGNDILHGETGNDIYLFNLGDGQDTISEGDWAAGNLDTIRFGDGITKNDITITPTGLYGRDMVLSIKDTEDQITIQYWGGGAPYRIERVEFADGMVYDAAFLPTLIELNPIVIDGATDDNDTLFGDDGNNALSGGAGNDTLSGGAGNDIYLFNPGDGQDIISECDWAAGNLDIIRFGDGITENSITFARDGLDLVLGINGTSDTSDQITIQGWGDGTPWRIEGVEFADGKIWDAAVLQSIIESIPIVGTNDENTLQAWSGENTTLQGLGGDDTLNGRDGDDTLYGGSESDLLNGGAGNDYLSGDAGNDIYVFNRGDGQDTISDYDSTAGILDLDIIRFGAEITNKDITITKGGYFSLIMSINDTSDQIELDNWGRYPEYKIERVEFADDDTVFWDAAELQARITDLPIVGTNDRENLWGWVGENNTIQGLGGDDDLIGDSGNDTLIGGEGNDKLYGNGGNDTLEGGRGIDYLAGGDSGNDTYLFNRGDGSDTIDNYKSTPEGLDTIRFGAGIAANDIAFTIIGPHLVLGINGTTDSIKCWNNVYDEYKVEQLAFANGLIYGLSDIQLGGVDADTLNGTDADSILIGGAGNDTLNGNGGNDLLNGGSGADSMSGGTGDDTYVVDDIGDTVSENLNVNEGMDTVLSSVTYTLGTNLENLTLTGTANLTGTGNDLDNVLIANNGGNYLYAGAGNDTVNGGTGNDILDGGAGDDFIAGGAGDDTYFVDSYGDIVIEAAGGGTDTVKSGTFVYCMGDNVENLTLTAGAYLGIGNALDNVIIANNTGDYLAGYGGNDTLNGGVGADWLDGGAGDDFMAGGAGNDTYFVDSYGDIVIEAAGGGTDTVKSSTYVYCMGANVENLILTAGGYLGVGNALDNVITANNTGDYLAGGVGNDTLSGGAGADWLDGGTGDDVMAGGAGNDTYFVDSYGDVVTEAARGGTDTVKSSVTFTLRDNVENLTLTGGTAAIEGTGNALNNAIIGNRGNNILDGGLGNDTLAGNKGNDTFILGRGYGIDTVIENDSTIGNSDVAQFLAGVAADQLWFRQAANNLEVSIIGTTDKLVVKDWYLGAANHVEQFATIDGGKTLLDSNVQNLVSAMAAFAPPAAGQINLPTDYQTSLAPVIAANWN